MKLLFILKICLAYRFETCFSSNISEMGHINCNLYRVQLALVSGFKLVMLTML